MSTYLGIAKSVDARLHKEGACVIDTPTNVGAPRTEAPSVADPTSVDELPTPVVLQIEVQPSVSTLTRSYRQWVTGNIPQTATIPLAKPLPPPKYHDIPRPCIRVGRIRGAPASSKPARATALALRRVGRVPAAGRGRRK